jgi:hypothetical protein
MQHRSLRRGIPVIWQGLEHELNQLCRIAAQEVCKPGSASVSVDATGLCVVLMSRLFPLRRAPRHAVHLRSPAEPGCGSLACILSDACLLHPLYIFTKPKVSRPSICIAHSASSKPDACISMLFNLGFWFIICSL